MSDYRAYVCEHVNPGTPEIDTNPLLTYYFLTQSLTRRCITWAHEY